MNDDNNENSPARSVHTLPPGITEEWAQEQWQMHGYSDALVRLEQKAVVAATMVYRVLMDKGLVKRGMKVVREVELWIHQPLALLLLRWQGVQKPLNLVDVHRTRRAVPGYLKLHDTTTIRVSPTFVFGKRPRVAKPQGQCRTTIRRVLRPRVCCGSRDQIVPCGKSSHHPEEAVNADCGQTDGSRAFSPSRGWPAATTPPQEDSKQSYQSISVCDVVENPAVSPREESRSMSHGAGSVWHSSHCSFPVTTAQFGEVSSCVPTGRASPRLQSNRSGSPYRGHSHDVKRRSMHRKEQRSGILSLPRNSVSASESSLFSSMVMSTRGDSQSIMFGPSCSKAQRHNEEEESSGFCTRFVPFGWLGRSAQSNSSKESSPRISSSKHYPLTLYYKTSNVAPVLFLFQSEQDRDDIAVAVRAVQMVWSSLSRTRGSHRLLSKLGAKNPHAWSSAAAFFRRTTVAPHTDTAAPQDRTTERTVLAQTIGDSVASVPENPNYSPVDWTWSLQNINAHSDGGSVQQHVEEDATDWTVLFTAPSCEKEENKLAVASLCSLDASEHTGSASQSVLVDDVSRPCWSRRHVHMDSDVLHK